MPRKVKRIFNNLSEVLAQALAELKRGQGAPGGGGGGPQAAAAGLDKKGEALRPPLSIGNGSQSCMRKFTRILNKRVAGRLRMGMPVRAVMSSSVARSSSREGLMSVNQML